MKFLITDNFEWTDKCLFLDFDGTIVKTRGIHSFAKNANDWMFIREGVSGKIRNMYKKGYSIVIISNQTRMTNMKLQIIQDAMEKINVEYIGFIANDPNVKKHTNEFCKLIINELDEYRINIKRSIMVGDALGRPYDHGDDDLVFANKIGVNIQSPETFFPFKRRNYENKLIFPKKQNVVIPIGFPGSGKSTISKVYKNKGYIVIDNIKQLPKLLKEGYSVFVDSTNLSKKKRDNIIKHIDDNILVVGIWLDVTLEESKYYNYKRKKEEIVPLKAYFWLSKTYEKPTSDEFDKFIHLH